MNETRRRFLKSSAAVAGGLAAGAFRVDRCAWAWERPYLPPPASPVKAPNDQLNIACVGVGGRGGAHVGPAMNENLVAVCDVSEGTLGACLKRVERHYADKGIKKPLPTRFTDYRRMLDEMGDQIDAVVVAIPDHHHAPASIRAIRLGKHVYCEKPLTHDIHEARTVAEAARYHGVATQMGNQGRAGANWRLLCEYLWSGQIGNILEVHTWTDRPGIPKRFWWPQGGVRPPYEDPVPEWLHWDVWLGQAPPRPYVGKYRDGKFKGKNVYCPFVWRGWWDFGTGALGDIACHAWSGIFTALRIEHAAAVTLIEDTGDCTDDMFPSASIIEWEIPARGDMPPCKLRWYDGGKYPPRELADFPEGKEFPENGTIIVTDNGRFWGTGRPNPIGFSLELKDPEPTIPRCESDHFREWVAACKSGPPAFSNFDHAGPLTEMVLLGNLALKAGAGNRVEWNGSAMEVTNLPELNQWVRREHRAGWEVT